MSTAYPTSNEIRARGVAALIRELGPLGYLRFIRQFTAGAGDFTKERQLRTAALSVDQIRDLIDHRRDRRSADEPLSGDEVE